MKKVLMIAAVALFVGSVAQAQDIYKQTGGEQNIEFLFAPLGSSPIGINGIKYRKFTSATTAWRAEVFLGFNSSTDITVGGVDDDIELKTTNSDFSISIAPGIEKHFPGTDRLSPYVGGVVLVGFGRTATGNEVIVNADEDIENLVSSNGNITLGANAIIGVDYYFADNIYVGAELGFGVAFTSELDSKTENIVFDDNLIDYEIETEEVPNGNSFGIGPNVVAQIRVGFLF